MRPLEKPHAKYSLDQQKPQKIRVLLATHIGEPRGGVSTCNEAILDSDLKDFVDLHFVETSKGMLQSGDRGKWKFINWINAIENILRFLITLVTVKPDLVHIGTAYGASFMKHSAMVCLARLFLVPVVIQPHCSFHKLIPEYPSFWKTYVLYIFRLCVGVIIISKEWEVLSSLIPNIMIHYIPNAIDVKPYRRIPRPRENINEVVNILYLGHITKEKGIFDLVHAVAKINNNYNGVLFSVNIVGESLYKEELDSVKELIKSNDLQGSIKVFEPEYGAKKIDRFASTDIYVLPTYHEGMPMSIIEAMAAGLPIVASNVGGIPDLVDDQETGLLINPGDVHALSTALFELLGSHEKRLAMGAVGRKKAIEKYNIQRTVDELVMFYQGIVTNY